MFGLEHKKANGRTCFVESTERDKFRMPSTWVTHLCECGLTREFVTVRLPQALFTEMTAVQENERNTQTKE